MTSFTERRLSALERAIVGGRSCMRVFATVEEAEADDEPASPGTAVIRIITGVARKSSSE